MRLEVNAHRVRRYFVCRGKRTSFLSCCVFPLAVAICGDWDRHRMAETRFRWRTAALSGRCYQVMLSSFPSSADV